MAILGVDQGSTKTVAIVAEADGRILGKGLGPGACHFFDGLEKAMAAVSAAARQALAQAGMAPGAIRSISAGMAGANWPEEITALAEGLSALFPGASAKVHNDCLIALRGGTASPVCGVICAGTGLNAALRGPDGVTHVYNNYIEDLDQGASGLGRRTLRAVFLAEIGILPPTRLTAGALAHFGLEQVDQLLLAYQRQQLSRPVATICPELFEVAAAGDPVALDLLADFGVSVSRYLVAGIQKFGLQDQALDIVVSGGVFKARHPLLFETVSTEMQRVAPRARVVNALYEPVVGALLLALDETGGGTEPAGALANCRTTVKKLGLLRLPAATPE